MKISVIIATYNGSKYIVKQLESIVNQTLPPDEILIFDDNSTDRTISIINNFIKVKGTNIIKIKKNNNNLGYALNFWNGLKNAKGDSVFLCDQDDIWLPNKIQDMCSVFEKKEEILALNSSYQLIDQDGKKIFNKFKLNFRFSKGIKKVKLKEFIRSPRYPGMAMAIRRELIEKVKNIPEGYVYAHDWMLNQAASMENGMYFYNSKLTQYRQHKNNTVGTISSLNKENMKLHRLNTINDQYVLAEICEKLYLNDNEMIKFTLMIMKVLKKRETYVKMNNLFQESLLFIRYHKYMSARCYLGDVYCILLHKRGRLNEKRD